MSIWHPFDPMKFCRQRLPLERDFVLLKLEPREQYPGPIVVGYLKYGTLCDYPYTGWKQPYFVRPGVDLPLEVVGWCDILPDEFEWYRTEEEKN